MIGIDAIVCNYKTPEDLDEFLSSLWENQPTIPWSLYIANVDPSHQDRLVARQWVSKFDNGAVAVDWPSNVGYAHAINEATVSRRGDALVAFNADVVITPGLIDDCYAALMARDDWGVLGPRQINERQLLVSAGVFGTNREPVLRDWQQPDTQAVWDTRDDAVSVSGSVYFVKRSVWDELTVCPAFVQFCRERSLEAHGAFLPTPHYYEEMWASVHARAHGYKVVYYGQRCCIHKWHRASPIGGVLDQRMSISREIFRAACDLHGIEHE